jgi:hypothetical protein
LFDRNFFIAWVCLDTTTMKLTRGRLAKIRERKNESRKVLLCKKRERNITSSNWRKKQANNLQNKTLKNLPCVLSNKKIN